MTVFSDRYISVKELIELTSLSRATIYRRRKESDFPKAYQLGPKRIGWRLSEVEEWRASLDIA
ncbi:AlpA family phage regulatory protein [Thalassotalea ponticola]|uniref:helix-turn-helix transcriptional regulator n=1 Tax=Thalassotalea ponticola TaxID=1523392 RepID=UPI0025B552F6|nr:AlpA family phage regulatory protein [Thalassotalea ponticola]MDN3652315.1 AlpA family phage regulatory protein [Thalassotalea ponticola]